MLGKKPYPINSYDSAVGGAFEICQEIAVGKSIAQAIAEYTPIYQQKVDQANTVIDWTKETVASDETE